MGKKLSTGGALAAATALAVSVVLSACGTAQPPAAAPKSGDVTASQTAPPPTENWSTFTSTVMGLSFRYPSEWSIAGAPTGTAQEGPEILDADGKRLGFAVLGSSFGFSPCGEQHPYELLASIPISVDGMDTSQAPTTIQAELHDYSSSTLDPMYLPGGKPVSVHVQMYSTAGHPAGTTKSCGPIGVIQTKGEYGMFGAYRGFDTVQEARAYVTSHEYDQVVEMLSSLKFL